LPSEDGGKSARNLNGDIINQVTNGKQEMEMLRRENDYMDHLLQKVKDVFKIDSEAALIDLEIYLTKLRPESGMK